MHGKCSRKKPMYILSYINILATNIAVYFDLSLSTYFVFPGTQRTTRQIDMVIFLNSIMQLDTTNVLATIKGIDGKVMGTHIFFYVW